MCSVQCSLLWNPVQSLPCSQSQQLLRGRPLVSHRTQEECHWRQRRCCQQGQWTPALEFSSEWLNRRLRRGIKIWGVGLERMPHIMRSFPPFFLFKPFIYAFFLLHFFFLCGASVSPGCVSPVDSWVLIDKAASDPCVRSGERYAELHVRFTLKVAL